MNKKILLPILTIGLVLSSCGGDNTPVAHKLDHLDLDSSKCQTTFTYGEEFNYDGLKVVAVYDDDTSITVSNYKVNTPDMYVLGSQDVKVEYLTVSKTYQINIVEAPSYFPTSEVITFLSSRGVDNPANYLTSKIKGINKIISSEIVEEDIPYYHVETNITQTYYQEIMSELASLNWNNGEGGVLVDPTLTVGVHGYSIINSFAFDFYAYSDLISIPPEEDPEEGEDKELDFPLQNAGYIAKETNLDGKSYTFNQDFTFSFAKNGSNTPISEKSNYVALYTNNSLTISSKFKMKKIEFTNQDASKNGDLTVEGVKLVKTNELTSWNGEAKSITFTASSQYRFSNIKITYFEHAEPVIEGLKTIKEVLDFAKDVEYTPTNGWYLTNSTVTAKVKAIDAIDSVTTSGLDANARGKVLCVDETGYIVCSSGVSKSNPIDFYQRVKNYIKEGTTTYIVTGKLAFFNDVVEIKVDSYQYDPDLEINYDLNDFVTDGVNSSELLMNHCKSIKTNKDGYGVGKIIKMPSLTYFNKYNDAGSYYFLDQEGKLVPIYSLLDKDRSSLQENKVYDIIGFESLYKGRPSLRILGVSINSESDPASFDFANAVSKENTKYFYNVDSESSNHKEEFYNSVTTIYKMDVYVSSYAYDKYTFNSSYYEYNKSFTTGNSQVAAAQHYSLGVFNEDIEYKQLFTDFNLASVSSKEEADNLQLTLYFTLAFLDTVDGKKMWRVNVFEDLVFGLDYYESETQNIDFNSMTPSHDENKQWYQQGDLKITNASTDINNYSYSVYYLKVVDGTSLTIEFNKPIIAFTLYHKTYSYIAGVGELAIASYRQFKDYTVFLLSEATTTIYIDDFAVGGNRSNTYLGIESITVNY